MDIQHPILKEAFEHNWYYPCQDADIVSTPQYQQAKREGWEEWIETDLDIEAIKNGYRFDLSKDKFGQTIYWIDGAWQTLDGQTISVEDEEQLFVHDDEDLENHSYVGAADHMMRFCETFLHHTKAPLEGKPYRFLPWMRKIVATLFGWVHEKSGYRRYEHLYIAVAKKNGKSALLSVLAIYMLVADGTPKAQVYSCACDRNQARIIYDEAAHMVRGSERIEEIVTIVDSRARLVHSDSGSFYSVLSADAHRNDGLDSSCTLVDEIHRHPNRKLYTVMKRAGRARPQKLLAVITTYGPSLSDGSIWAEVHNEAKQQLDGRRPKSWRNLNFIASAEPITVTTTETVPAGSTRIPVSRLHQPIDVGEIEFDLSAYEDGSKATVIVSEPTKRFQDYIEVEPLDQEIPQFSQATANNDWRTKHAICRANPSAGVVFPISDIENDIESARSPEAEAETKQLSLNIVSGSGRKWISDAAWLACGKMQVQPKKLIGRHCYAGFDCSFGNDLTALGLAFPNWEPYEDFESVEKPRIDMLTFAWTPDQFIVDREELEQFPYRHYANQEYLIDGKGCVRFCPGSVIDYGMVANEIIEILSLFNVMAVAYDPNYAQFSIGKIEESGITCIAHRQGAVSMSPSVKRFEQLLLRKQIAHGNNPILDRAVEGAVLHPPDKAGNTYLSKSKSHNRIDPLVAHVMAVGWACNPPQVSSGAYSGDGGCGMWG